MDRIADLVEAVTHRLRPDAELQAEVAREVRAHIEDAIAAAEADGMDEEQATDYAVKSFGDVEVIGQRLFAVNRRRMRLRAVAKWAGRVALLPAGVALAVWLVMGTLDFLQISDVLRNIGGEAEPVVQLLGALGRRFRANPVTHLPRPDLSEEEKLIYAASGTQEAGAKALVSRYPDNPVYHGHRAILWLHKSGQAMSKHDGVLPSPAIEEALRILDAGERAEPDNAFWNYMKAMVLMYLSGAAKQEPDPSFTYPSVRGGETIERKGERLLFKNRPMFERGLAEYRTGTTKGYCTSHELDFSDRYLQLFARPRDLRDQIQMIAIAAGQLLPDFACYRHLVRGTMAYANLLIKEGRADEAAELVRTAPVPGYQIGVSSRMLIELLVACACRDIALRQGAVLYERMGKPAEAAAALAFVRKESFEGGEFRGKARPEGPEHMEFLRKQGGLLGSVMFTTTSLSDRTPVLASQRAERFAIERAALGSLALAFLMVILAFGMPTVAGLWLHRKDTRGPKLYFIGWRRLGVIVLVAVALPLGLYWALTRAPGFGSAQYGINYMPGRILAEIGGTMAVVFGLAVGMSWWAARARCRAAGITERVERRTSCMRSALPPLVVCLLAVGAASQAYLLHGESSAVAALNQPGRRMILDELKYLSFAEYQEYLKGLPDHGALSTEGTGR